MTAPVLVLVVADPGRFRKSQSGFGRVRHQDLGACSWATEALWLAAEPQVRQAAQLQSLEILQTIGEVAVALAGFSGVVAVLGHRGRGSWTSAELLQLRTLVEPSLVALFGSLLPGTIRLACQSEALVWRLSNGALSLLGLAAVAGFVARARIAGATTGQRILLALVVVAIGAQLLAAGGVLTQSELIFVLGVVLALVVAAYNFLLLLFPIGRAA